MTFVSICLKLKRTRKLSCSISLACIWICPSLCLEIRLALFVPRITLTQCSENIPSTTMQVQTLAALVRKQDLQLKLAQGHAEAVDRRNAELVDEAARLEGRVLALASQIVERTLPFVTCFSIFF